MTEIWITCVWNDEQVSSALVLCHSLQRTLTSKPVGILVNIRNLSKQLRLVLEAHFDLVVALDDDTCKTSYKNATEETGFLKIIAALGKLKLFRKIVYLSSNLLVATNIDNIFEVNSADISFSNDKCLGLITPPIFTLNFDTDTNLNTWITEFTKISLERISIVKFLKSPKDSDFAETYSSLNRIGQACVKFWKEIYNKHVKTCLENAVSFYPNFLSKSPKPFKNERIAVIGMSCRFAGANNPTEFWNLLETGKITVTKPPAHRNFPVDFQMPAGYLKDPIDLFDHSFFGISAKEVIYMDPQHRLLFPVIWEALENGGINSKSLTGSTTGLFLGSWNYQYKKLLNRSTSPGPNFFREYMGSSSSAVLGRIAMLLGVTGPTMAYESSCTASAVAVHGACKSLQNGESDFTLACGVNLIVTPFRVDDLPGMLAEDGLCKTFDVEADGYGRGEGCGVLVLKRLSDAVRDNDRILGLIRGTGIGQEGLTKSLATPTVPGEAVAMQRALKDAGVEPEEIGYLEMHGTGTVVGDTTEVKAVETVFRGGKRELPLMMGSVKANVGHAESCSGIAGIIQVLLALQKERIPRQVGVKMIKPGLKETMDRMGAVISLEGVSWKREDNGRRRMAGVNSFGMTGTNVHVVLEESPDIQPGYQGILKQVAMERPLHILKMSAKTEQALELLLDKYGQHLEQSEDSWEDMAYTGNVGRADWRCRSVVIAETGKYAAEKMGGGRILQGVVGGDERIGGKEICFLFTGQGSQFLGMGKGLYETCPVFQASFDHCLETISEIDFNLGRNLRQVLWEEKTDDLLKRCAYSQTAIFCVEYSLLQLWRSWGIKPTLVLGHSLGEFGAAVAAGVLEVEEALRLIVGRCLLIETLDEGAMLVLRKEEYKVRKLFQQFLQNNRVTLEIAAVNSPEQTVIAGDSEAVQHFQEFCKGRGIKGTILEASHAYHSDHMTPILEKYGQLVSSILEGKGKSKEGRRTMTCQYISGMTGDLMENLEEIRNAQYWINHTRKSVQFWKASTLALKLGTGIFVEVGPQPVLSALTLQNGGDLEGSGSLLVCPSLKRKEDEWATLFHSLGMLYVHGVDVDWEGVDKWRVRKKVDLPNYPFIGKRFWPTTEEADVTQDAKLGISNVENCGALRDTTTCKAVAGMERPSFWETYKNLEDGKAKSNFVEKSICKIVKDVLKVDKNEELSSSVKFQEMGVDSLMFVEIWTSLQKLLLGRHSDSQKTTILSQKLVKDCHTIRDLTTLIEKFVQ